MGRVGWALMRHELLERTRDRWVLLISALFALLAWGITLYGSGSGVQAAAALTGPSLVTLAAFFIPLTALVLGHDAVVGEVERNTLGMLLALPIKRWEMVTAKFTGRLLALAGAVALGLGGALYYLNQNVWLLMGVLGHALLLGAAFLSIGVLISCMCKQQVTAAAAVVSAWFLLVFFYDLGLLGFLVATDGAVSSDTIGRLILANPAGLFRLTLVSWFSGEQAVANLGLTVGLPGLSMSGLIWAAWIAGPLLISSLLLSRRKAFR